MSNLDLSGGQGTLAFSRLLGSGLSNVEIADQLHLGVTTVKAHVASLMTKTGRTNRVQLAVPANQYGLTAE